MVLRRGIRTILVTLCLSAVIATGVALADFTEITDGNKTRGPLDIRSASAGHASSTKLIHQINTRGRIPISRKANFCVEIYFTKPTTRGSSQEIDRFVCANPRQDFTDVTDLGGNSFGKARVLRPDDHSIAFRFRHKAIANDAVYWWGVASFYNARRGPCSGQGCGDSAPNGNRSVRHRVESVRFTG